MEKIKRYGAKLKDLKLLTVLMLVILLVVIVIIDPFGKEIKYDIEDKCGKFVNLYSHTIEDEPACRTRCRAQCESQDHSYKSVEFTLNTVGCNICTCKCRS